MGYPVFVIDGKEIHVDQTDASRIAERLAGTELGGRIVAATMGSGANRVEVDDDPVERQKLFDAGGAVAAGTADEKPTDPLGLLELFDALRAGGARAEGLPE